MTYSRIEQINRRCHLQPMPFWAAAAAIGTYLGVATARYWLVTGVCLLIGTLVCCLFLQRNSTWMVCLILFSVSLIRSFFIFIPIETVAVPAGPVQITGSVQSVRTGNWGNQVVLSTRSVEGQRLRIQLFCREQLRPGDVMEATVNLSRSDGARSPGGFNQKRWLKNQGIGFEASLVNGGDVQILSTGQYPMMLTWLDRLRQRMRFSLNQCLPPESSGLLYAMLTGDRANMTDSTRMDFRQSG
ncbi:MAG: DUF4131 domain-containing protein, partial [Clostridiaceae bacterium]|nr:DUF4131 domain-containing protein [Clostridiaceae bacterium]